MTRRAVFSVVMMSALLVALVGCGGGPSVNPITGKVTVGGQQASNEVTVTFTPLDASGMIDPAGVEGSGAVQDDGTYIITSGVQGHKGLPAGKYKVSLTELYGDDYMTGDGPSVDPAAKVAKEGGIPTEWQSAETSPMEVEVKSGQNTIDIEA